MSYLLFRKAKFIAERYTLEQVKEALEVEPELRVLNSSRPFWELEAAIKAGHTSKLIRNQSLRGLSLKEVQELEVL